MFMSTAQRYEPGVLNTAGMYAMTASIRALLDVGMDTVASRIQMLRRVLCEKLGALGFELVGPKVGERSGGMVTVFHERANLSAVFRHLEKNGVTASLRHDRAGREHLRFSPHFYNTEDEFDQLVRLIREVLQ